MPAESRLLKRVFDIDVKSCTRCGQLKILAAIEEPVAIVRILAHRGLPAGVLARLRSLTREQDAGSAREPKDVLGP